MGKRKEVGKKSVACCETLDCELGEVAVFSSSI